MLLKGYLAVAVAVSVFGILTYFRLLPDSDTFIFASRSRSTFKDPNVLGAFLVLPTLLALQRTMTGRLRDFLVGHGPDDGCAGEHRALRPALSRGAWGASSAAAALMLGTDLSDLRLRPGTAARSSRLAARSAPSCSASALIVVVLVVAPRQRPVRGAREPGPGATIPAGSAGSGATSSAPAAGARPAVRHRPLQFLEILPRGPPQLVALDPLTGRRRISGAAYLALTVVTLTIGLRYVLVRTPWRAAYIAIYATFAAEVGESIIIDVQHWRGTIS